LADFNQNIKVTANTKPAEQELGKLDKILKGLSSFTLDVGKGAAQGGIKLAQKNLQEYGKTLGAIDRQLGGFGQKLGSIAKAFDFGGKTAVGIAGINALGTALAAIPRVVTGGSQALQSFGGVLAGLTAPAAKVAAALASLGPQGLATAGGIAAATAAFMAFSPAVKKVVTGLDNLVLGGKIQSAFDGIKGKVEGTKQSFLGLNTTIKTTVEAMNELAEGMSLRQLNSQVSSLTKEMQSFNSATQEAWEAAQGLVRAQKAQVLEQKALNDLVRKAQGLQPQDVRNAEVARRSANLTSGRNAQNAAKEAAADAKRLADELWEANKAWYAFEDAGKKAFAKEEAERLRKEVEALAEQMRKVALASKDIGIRKTQASAAVQERKELERSVQIMRERSALLKQQAGANYPLSQLPAGRELLPGGNTAAAQPKYREMLNSRAVTEASKTLQIQYNWNQALKQGATIAADMRRIQAEDLKLQQQKVAKAYEQLSIKKREEDFERRLARLRQRNEERTQARKDFNDKVQGAAIGGAFPLLFGGGAGSIIGGALGGLNTSNPIFSVFTSAIGQMLDQWVATTTDLAKSLKNPTDAMAALEAAGYKVSDSTKNQVNRLLEVGRAYEAQSVVLAEVERKMGAGSVQGLNALAGEQKKLQDQWDQMAGALQGELLPALVGTIALLNSLAAGAKVLSKLQLPKWFINFLTVTNPGFALSRAQFEDAQRRGREVASKAPTRPELDPLVAQDAADKRLAAAERAEALRRQGLQLERQASDLRLQIEDQVYGFRQRAADIERANLDLRRSIEDEVFKKRQDIARIEADNDRKRAQIAIERTDLLLNAGRVTDNRPGGDLANQMLDALRQYFRSKAEGEANLQQKQRNFTIEMEDIRRASGRFQLDVARKVADIERQGIELTRDIERAKIMTARAIYDLQVQGADYQRDQLKNSLQDMVDAQQRLTMTNSLAGQTAASAGGIASIADSRLTPQAKAWLATIRFAEGTSGPNGYRTMFGGGLFNDMSRHPDRVIRSGGYASAAAGAYQFMPDTWRGVGGGAMTPERQDRAAVALAQGRGVNISNAAFTPQNVARLAPEWASFPTLGGGSAHNQPFKRFDDLQRYFQRALAQYGGGTQMSPLFQRGGGAPFAVGSTIPASATVAPAASSPVARPSLPASVGQASAALGVKAPGAIDVSKLLAQDKALTQMLLNAKTTSMELDATLDGLSVEGFKQQLELTRSSIVASLTAPLDETLKKQRDLAAYQREYGELIEQGVTPALAEQISQIREQVRLQLEQLSTVEANLGKRREALEAELAVTKGLKEQEDLKAKILEIDRQAAELRKEAIPAITQRGAAAEATAIQDSKGKQIRDYMTKLRGELNDTEGMIISLAGSIESEIGSAMSNAIGGVISGTTTVQEAMATMFRNIGASFIQMATEMIAKALILKVLGVFGGGGGGGFFAGDASLTSGGGIFGNLSNGFGGGGIDWTQKLGVGSYAGGGYTGSGPRSGGMDGKGGFLAMMHPQETVIDHTRISGASGGDAPVINQTITISNDGNASVASDDAGRFASMMQQVAIATIQKEQRPGGSLNRRR
jgi:muramidase (phage lysozyme)